MNKCGRDFRVLLSLMFLAAISVLTPKDVFAANFSVQSITPQDIVIPQTNYKITIMVNNTDSSHNITSVEITIANFSFVSGSNQTTATGTNFSAYGYLVKWLNETDEGFIERGGNSHNFSFNVSAPSSPGYYNLTINVTHNDGSSNETNITYTLILHNLTFLNLSEMQKSTNISQNLTYLVKITNNGNPTQETYNLSVVNCSNMSHSGSLFGILNQSSVTLNPSENVVVELNVSSPVGFYSSCILARHWNGSGEEEGISFVSSDDGVLLNSTFYGNLTPTNIYWTSTAGKNPFAGSNITVYNLTISNTGSINFSGGLAVYLMLDDVYAAQNVSSINIPVGGSYNISFANITVSSNGLHNLTAWVNPQHSVPETSYSDNNLTEQIFVGYNITIISIYGQNETNVAPNMNVTINVSVHYPDGNPVTGLSKEDFTVYDIWNGYTYQTLTYQNSMINTTFNSTMNLSGIYWFNITSYNPSNDSETTPGIHNITVSVSRNESGNVYSGNSSGKDYYYLMVPRIIVTLTAPSGTSVNEGNSRAISVNISNTGTDTAYNLYITATDNSDYLSVPSSPSCTATSLSNGSYKDCPNLFSATTSEVSSNEYATITVTAYVSHNYSGSPLVQYFKTGTIELTIVNVESSEGGGGGGEKTCSSDSQCAETENCTKGVCKTISCPNGEISDHMCFPYSFKINITSYPSVLQAVAGGETSAKVTVKNTGSRTFTAKLDVTLSGISANVSPSGYSLGAGESYQFTVNFTVPNSTSAGNLSGTFKAYVSVSTSTYDSKTFTFTVLPGEEAKSSINSSYQELLLAFENLSLRFNEIKQSGYYNQSVLSELENLINSLNSTLLEMKEALESGDYIKAQTLISQINTTLGNAETELENIKSQIKVVPQEYGIWFWVAVAVIIIFVLGFFLYMFLPSSHEGYHPEKGYIHPEAKKEGIFGKIKKVFRRKKEGPAVATTTSVAQSISEPKKDEGHYETFHYGEGYHKEKSYRYEYGQKERLGFLNRLRRRKEKKSPQMHLDQFIQTSQ